MSQITPQKDSGETLTEADCLVKKIICEDYEFDEHIRTMDIINHFPRYEQSLNKYGITAEEFFEQLSIKNKQVEEYSEKDLFKNIMEKDSE